MGRLAVMRILTWNIHGARDAPLTQIAAELRAQSPDVVCLNEVRRGHGRRLAATLGMRAFEAGCLIGPYGNAILTALPVTAFRRLRFSGIRRVDRRDAAIVTLADGLMVAAVHLGLRAPSRAACITELLDALPDRAVISGDMNEGPGGAAWEAIARRFDDTGDVPTFPASEPRARIDVIWVPRGAHVMPAAVVPTTSSDHRMVVVDLD
jgi:endonuclease/exonuclease/phosphatase family metal-dependent hydrolase